MSKISDDLRDYCKKVLRYTHYYDKLCCFADLIDHEMVELPKDKDGRPIHVGDTVYGCRSGMKMTISELRMTANGWSISTSRGYLTDAEVTHARPDGLERIADELDEMVDAADSADDRCEKLADLANRIRKLAGMAARAN